MRMYEVRDRQTGRRKRRWGLRGFTLLELVIATTILLILMGAALPTVRLSLKRQKEAELRRDLWQMRTAIDRYKAAADQRAFQTKVGSDNYPPDMETLVSGVDVQGKKLRFLRKIPTDPMTGKAEWGLRSLQDEPGTESWGGQNVFDVYSKALGKGLDGSDYKSW
ncbi:MAG TPA: type II secretion system protein [Candidatus Saccharimonadales bacterium]|nr:type II secretion system protein [Candidatus Saccharimonadales bacterium]